ncbi:MAB_1171c family putative transporter [Nocardia sp. NPDC046473]|uniref:MAB_1171c family putative transporter n=1 Tax=Nocardia sp. NPDC046473 TaxID=3155733 RepID=UPI0033DCD884
MTPTVPSGFAAPVLAFALVVVVARWLLADQSFGNRLVNRALSWMTAAAAIQVAGTGTDIAHLTDRIFLGGGAATLAYIYGIAALFASEDEDRARRRQPRYNAIAVAGAVIVVFIGRPADPMDPGFGWQAPLVWAIFNVPIGLFGIHVVCACVRELRVSGIAVRERLVFSALLFVGANATYAAVASGVRVVGGAPSDSPPADWTMASCLTFFMFCLLLSAPVVGVLLARAGWDRVGRRCRRLLPLWHDLTTAVPGIVLEQGPDRRDPELRLYRMLVEIQDALQHLKQYIPPGDRREQSVEEYAVQIALAVEGKQRGSEPAGTVVGGDRYELIAEDRDTELDLLLDLARVWPTARTTASEAALVR